ncbi:MAG TPA: hypothetical protein VNQ74_14510 [Burkholderiaceae bacterium]|nr:hypothetical protein [Burkholderiaceae bacterium]
MAGIDDRRPHEFLWLRGPNAPGLIVTQQRARAIGIDATPMALPLSEEACMSDIFALAADSGHKFVTLKASASEKS